MKLIDYKLTSNGNGPDRYGFTHNIIKKYSLPSFFKAITNWDHGWMYVPTPNIYKYNTYTSRNLNIVVSNMYKKNLLKKFTNRKIDLAPLPFLYYSNKILVDDSISLKNNKKNLLVMPAKKFVFAELSDENFHKYKNLFIDYIYSFKKDFDQIFFCLHASDIRFWENTLKKYNINYISGANPYDSNSYIRMFQIFSYFTHMSTNFFGSQIVYAASMNNKVSIAPDIPKYDINEKHILDFFQKYNKILNISGIIKEYSELFGNNQASKKLDFLVKNNPDRAVNHKEWADREMGIEYFIPIEKVINLLGFNYKLQIISKFKKLNRFFIDEKQVK